MRSNRLFVADVQRQKAASRRVLHAGQRQRLATRMRALLAAVTLTHLALVMDTAQAKEGFRCNPAGNQQEMNACALHDYKAADRELNVRYKQVMASLPPATRSTLRAEQRTWLKERDLRCKESVKDSEGGSVWPLEFYSCLAEATNKRTSELRNWEVKK